MLNTERIRQLAKEKGISLTFLCKKMNVAASFFIDIEKSGRTIPPERLVVIADVLGTTVEYLRGETDQKEKPAVSGELSKTEQELIKFLSALPEDKVNQVLEYAQLLSDREKQGKK